MPLMASLQVGSLQQPSVAIVATAIAIIFVCLVLHLSDRQQLELRFNQQNGVYIGLSEQLWRIGNNTRIGLYWVWLELEAVAHHQRETRHFLLLLTKLSDTDRRGLGYRITLQHAENKDDSCHY